MDVSTDVVTPCAFDHGDVNEEVKPTHVKVYDARGQKRWKNNRAVDRQPLLKTSRQPKSQE